MNTRIFSGVNKVVVIAVAILFALGMFTAFANASIINLSLTSPVGGEEWSGTQNIIWSYTDDDTLGGTVSILLSSGGSYNNLVTGVDVKDLSYAWDTTSIPDGSTYKIKILDPLTGVEDASALDFMVDNTAPITTYSVDILPDAVTGWYNISTGNPTVTLDCADNLSGCEKIEYGFDGATLTQSILGNTVSFAILSEGIKNIIYQSTDNAGNVEGLKGPEEIKVDTVAPTASVSYSKDPVKAGDSLVVTATFSEDMADSPAVNIDISGVNTVAPTAMTKVSATEYTYTHTVASGDGVATVAFSVGTDIAGNPITATPTSGATFTVDNIAPIIAEVTPVPTPDNDSTPDYTFSTDEAGTITYPGACSSATTSATPTNNTITLDTLGDGSYGGCSMVVTDAAGNASNTLVATTFVIDTVDPSVNAGDDKELNAIISVQNATVSDDSSGVDSYLWTQESGTGTITFGTPTMEDTMISASSEGTYVIRLTVFDKAGNSAYDEMTYVYDITAPTLSEVTVVPSLTNDNTPSWTFSSSNVGWLAGHSGGVIDYGGACGTGSLSTAVNGNNTTTFGTGTPLSDGIYSDCNIDVMDAAGNTSSILDLSSFEIDTAPAVTTSITTYDTNMNGKVDKVVIVFDDPVDDSTFTPSDFSIDGVTADGFDTDGTADDNTVFLTFGTEVDGTEEKTLVYGSTALDLAGNSIATFSTPATDEAGPVPMLAKTISTTEIEVVFSEDLDGVSASPSDFDVAGNTVNATSESNGVVTLTLDTAIGTGDTPQVTVYGDGSSAGLKDLNGNWSPQDYTLTPTDGVAPTLTSVTIESDNDADTVSPEWAKTGDTVTLTLSASEATAMPVVTIDGEVATVMLYSGLPNAWTATYTFTGGEAEGVIPFTVDFEDLVTPTANVGTQVTATTDSSEVFYDETNPDVNAGADKEVNVLVSQNAVTSDPTPNASGLASWAWTQESGPAGGTVTFSSATTEDTDLSADVDGTYVLRLTVKDNAGNVAYDEMTFIWDTTNPVVITSVPFDGALDVAVDASTATVIFDDAGNIVLLDSSKVILVNDATGVSYKGAVAVSGGDGSSKTLNIDYSVLENETRYRINVQPGAVKDVAGNVLTTNFISYFTTNVVPDTTAPDVPVITTSGATVDADYYTLSGTVADDGGQRVVNLYNGTVLAGSAVVSAGQTAWSINASLSQDSSNVFTAKATDEVGNISNASASVTIVEATPTAVIPTIAVNGTAIVASYTVSEATTRFASGLQFDTTNADSITANGDNITPATTITIATQAEAITLGLHVYNVIVTSSTGDTANITVAYQVEADPVADTVIPVIVLLGVNPQTFTAGDTYVELGATASDNIDGDISSSIVIDVSDVDMSTAGTYEVTYNVADTAGNGAVEEKRTVTVNAVFDDTASLAVTGIDAIKTYATADDTYANGWSWKYKITVPTTETQFSMKFSDFVSGANTILAGNNIRIYSTQASANATDATAVTITAADTYTTAIVLDADLEPATPGRQIEVTVEMKVPAGSAGGSYSASYGVQSL